MGIEGGMRVRRIGMGRREAVRTSGSPPQDRKAFGGEIHIQPPFVCASLTETTSLTVTGGIDMACRRAVERRAEGPPLPANDCVQHSARVLCLVLRGGFSKSKEVTGRQSRPPLAARYALIF